MSGCVWFSSPSKYNVIWQDFMHFLVCISFAVRSISRRLIPKTNWPTSWPRVWLPPSFSLYVTGWWVGISTWILECPGGFDPMYVLCYSCSVLWMNMTLSRGSVTGSICNMSLNVSTHVSSTLLPILVTQLACKPTQRLSYFSPTHVGKWVILISL